MELARFDVCDLVGEFEAERFFHWSELRAIQQEAERLGEDWWEIYFQAVCEEEIYGSDSDPEWRENE
jgi:hypothetical protein